MKFCKINLIIAIIVFLILNFNSCSQFNKNDPINTYMKYHDFGGKICAFNGDVTYEFSDKKENVVKYKIKYSKELGCEIVKYVSRSLNAKYKLNNDEIIYDKQGVSKKIYDDTFQNRNMVGLPAHLGMDPYYFLGTDINKSDIEAISEDTVKISYNHKGTDITALINLKGQYITDISVKIAGEDIYKVKYDDYKKYYNSIYFPMKYKQVFINGNASSKEILVKYNLRSFNLCFEDDK